MTKEEKDSVLILGNGFLGKEFVRHGFNNFTTRKEFEIVDNLNFKRLEEYISKSGKNIKYIVNTIGIANTRYCEDDSNFNHIMLINAKFLEALSNFCYSSNITLVHISTGCLYDNRGKGLCTENDLISAHCNYTVSKWVGEKSINKLCKHLIIRPRLFFSDIPNRFNLINKFKNFDKILNEFNSVTSTRTIVEAVEALIDHQQTGIFNVANDGAYTIKQLSEAIGYKWSSNDVISQEELHKSQNLFLVNNVMDLSKLKQFYKPRDAIKEIKELAQLQNEIK